MSTALYGHMNNEGPHQTKRRGSGENGPPHRVRTMSANSQTFGDLERSAVDMNHRAGLTAQEGRSQHKEKARQNGLGGLVLETRHLVLDGGLCELPGACAV